MSRWFRRRRSKKRLSPPERPSLKGCAVLLRRLDQGREGSDLLGVLAKRHRLLALDGERLRYRIMVDHARFPDEAVVQLACELDEIDPSWQDHLAWPKTTGFSEPGDLDGGEAAQPD